MIASFIHETVKKNIPMKEIKSQSLPWVTSKIRRLIRRRDKAHIKEKGHEMLDLWPSGKK